MDKCTHEVRKQRWKNIIDQCLQRPEGMTVKQWLDENNICEQTYYHWLKRIRQETYELATTSANTTCNLRKNSARRSCICGSSATGHGTCHAKCKWISAGYHHTDRLHSHWCFKHRIRCAAR